MTTKQSPMLHRQLCSVFSWVWLLAGVCVAAYFLWPAADRGAPIAAPNRESHFASIHNRDQMAAGVATRKIEDIRVGDRVFARNPQIDDQERSKWVEPNWQEWGHAKLRMQMAVVGVLEIDLIRPRTWMAKNNFKVGAEVFFDLPEMGAYGNAQVVALGACPEVRGGRGQVVTATFSHPPATDVLEVSFDDVDGSIGVTDNHLFWSVDREEYRPIGEMAIGERVLTFSGDTKRIAQKLARPGPQTVYNLEVYGEHVYFVGSEGVLAHNLYKDANGRWHRDNGEFATKLGRPKNPTVSVHGNARSSPKAQHGYHIIDKRNGKVMKVGVVEADKGVHARFLEQRDHVAELANANKYKVDPDDLIVVKVTGRPAGPGARGKIYDWESKEAQRFYDLGEDLPGHVKP